MHLMKDEPFQRLKERWNGVKEFLDNPKAFDQEIVPAIKVINEVEGLVTIFSCQGHTVPKGEGDHIDAGYIMFGVQDPKVLYRFYEILGELEGNRKHGVRLTMTSRMDVTVEPIADWYQVWNLTWVVHHPSRNRVWANVNKAATQAVEEYKHARQT